MRATSICIRFVLVSFCFALSCSAQDSPPFISGPVLGFIEDGDGATIQPIIGVLGASVVGQPLALGFEFHKAAISPKHNFALAVQREVEQPVFINLASQPVAASPIPGPAMRADALAISPAGTAAIFYDQSQAMVRSVAGFPDTGSVVFQIDVSDFPGNLRSLTVSDDGALALLSFQTVDQTTLWLVTINGFRWLVPAQRPSAAAFVANRHDALIGDDAAQEVFLLSNIDQEANRTPIASFGEGFDAIADVAASEDAARVFISSRSSEKLTIVDLQAQVSTSVDCQCRATG